MSKYSCFFSVLGGTDAESESSNDGDDLDAEDVDYDEEALMLPKRSQFKSSSIISGFERARLSPSHFPTLLEEQLLIYKRPGSVESLESFDPVNR